MKLLHKFLTGARGELIDLEREAHGRHDPDLLEHCAIVGAGLLIVEVALDHASDRLQELRDDERDLEPV